MPSWARIRYSCWVMPTMRGTGASSMSSRGTGMIGMILKHHLKGAISLLKPKMKEASKCSCPTNTIDFSKRIALRMFTISLGPKSPKIHS